MEGELLQNETAFTQNYLKHTLTEQRNEEEIFETFKSGLMTYEFETNKNSGKVNYE